MVAVAYGSCRLRELFITKFKSQFKWDFAKVVLTRAGRLQEWSQGELRLYSTKVKLAVSWGGLFIWSKLGQLPSEMHFRTFQTFGRIRNGML